MKKEIFVDRISIFNFFDLVKLRKSHRIYVLDDVNHSNQLILKIFTFFNIAYEEKNFLLGNLISSSEKNLYTLSLKLSSELSFDIAKKLCDFKFLSEINRKYGNRTVELFLAKKLLHYLTYYSNRILVSKNLSKQKKPIIILSRPEIFDEEDLKEKFKEEDLRFYLNPFSNPGPYIEKNFSFDYFFISNFIKFFFKKVFAFINSFFVNKTKLYAHENDILVMSPLENELPQRNGFKNQSFWKKNKKTEKYLLFSEGLREFDVKKSFYPYVVINDIENIFLKRNTANISLNINLKKIKRSIFLKLFSNQSNVSRYLLFELYKLFDKANMLIYVINFFGIRKFLFYRTDFPITDAIQVISKELNISTVCFQYSDMNFPSPLMMTSSDFYLSFSEQFKDLFKTNGLGPKYFISNGYPHDYLMEENSSGIKKVRENLKNSGANFIISFFNESEQKGKWAHHNREFNLSILEFLSQLILNHKNIGLILKPQKSLRTIRDYKKNKLINDALNTGRLIELHESSKSKHTYNLNLIYPSMAALASDLCIGIAFGGTAAIESALTGTKTVLLNLTKDHYAWSKLLKSENIIFTSLEDLKIEIDSFFKNNKNSNLGDWNKVIHLFDDFRDSKGDERIGSFLEEQ